MPNSCVSVFTILPSLPNPWEKYLALELQNDLKRSFYTNSCSYKWHNENYKNKPDWGIHDLLLKQKICSSPFRCEQLKWGDNSQLQETK